VKPTINLLTNLDTLHPDVLLQHSIEPEDYKAGLVFRSAIESIRGTFISSSKVGRERLVGLVLEGLKQKGNIADFQYSGSSGRHDFTIVLEREPDRFAALEVKGGEGNSINISIRPRWASEFAIWCHLDGAIIQQPSHGARAIVGRIVGEMVQRQKHVDMLFFKDVLCGTRARPCPKYPGRESEMGLDTAPDIFLFPQRVPLIDDPEPPVHNLETLSLPKRILDLFGINAEEVDRHIWHVSTKLVKLTDSSVRSESQIIYMGQVIDTLRSRPWSTNA
jgi:hypothetical protein